MEKKFKPKIGDEPWYISCYRIIEKKNLVEENGWLVTIGSEEGLLQTVKLVGHWRKRELREFCSHYEYWFKDVQKLLSLFSTSYKNWYSEAHRSKPFKSR